jgi:hypothetical protein
LSDDFGPMLGLLEPFPAKTERSIDTRQVLSHRCTRSGRVPCVERSDDGAVIAQRCRPQFGRLKVVLHPFPDGSAPAVPQVLNDRNESAVVGGSRDAQVKIPIRRV